MSKLPDLTLPGSIPGLLRRGSPVLEGATECVIVSIGDVDDAGVPYAMAAECVAEHVNCCPLGDLSLDLRSATGRAHAAWWLGRKWKGCEFAAWEPAIPDGQGPRWGLYAHARHIVYGVRWQRKMEWNVPALADLDPNDPRLLPDGSRWVDAEALRLVCLHVAGMGVE